MLILGLTGSIGMGKSATARAFAEAGVPVHEADAVVHQLYAGEAVAAIEQAFPGSAVQGRVDRGRLSEMVVGDAQAMGRLESIVHPLVREAERRFLVAASQRGAGVALLDIPLLFETGGEARVDAVVVVSAPEPLQRMRVLGRAGMTAEKLDGLLAKQLPDREKRKRAHFIVDTSRSFDSARAQVRGILRAVAVIPGRHSVAGWISPRPDSPSAGQR
jgi:dephospho-CoA kinase